MSKREGAQTERDLSRLLTFSYGFRYSYPHCLATFSSRHEDMFSSISQPRVDLSMKILWKSRYGSKSKLYNRNLIWHSCSRPRRIHVFAKCGRLVATTRANFMAFD